MSIFSGPKIIKDSSLILNLDAGNRKSYSGSGTSWNDLSSIKNVATLNGSPSFSSSYGGYITFNGTTNQYAQVVNANPYNFTTGLFTLECWAAVISNNGAGYGRFFEHVYTNGYAFMIDGGNGQIAFEINGNGTRTVYNKGSTFVDNIWRQYLVVRTGSTTASIYINGRNVANGNVVGGAMTSTSPLQISSSSYPLGFNVAIARVYNRALTANEVYNNYIADRGRFGI